MAIQTLNTIKNWFKTGLIPSELQFWDTWDSFWHKEDTIPAENINGLGDLLNNKADREALENHLSSTEAHEDLFHYYNSLIEANQLAIANIGEVTPTTGEANSDFIVFSWSGTTANSTDWYSPSLQYRGKYNQTYTANSNITDANAFADDSDAKGYALRIPYDCKVIKAYIFFFTNGGNANTNLTFKVRNYEIPTGTYSGNMVSSFNNKIVMAKTIVVDSPNIQNHVLMTNPDIDINGVLKEGSLMKLYFNSEGNITAIQNPQIILQIKKNSLT